MEEEDEFYPGYGSSIPPDDEDFIPNVPLPSQEEAIALDRQLTPMVPAPNFNSGEVAGPFQGSGNAMSEFLTGKPGLFVQGGSSLPAGQISVNGVLERSQAAPQPIPWWITAADEFKEQRRQEEFLKGLLSQVAKSSPRVDPAKAINRARTLQAQFQLQADLKAGVPLRDAMIKNPALFAGNPATMARLAGTGKAPFEPTEKVIGGVTYVQESPNRWSPKKGGVKDITPGQELSAATQMLRLATQNLKDLPVEATEQDRLDANAEVAEWKARVKELSPSKKTKQTQAPELEQRQLARAKDLRAQNPGWAKEKVLQEARKLK